MSTVHYRHVVIPDFNKSNRQTNSFIYNLITIKIMKKFNTKILVALVIFFVFGFLGSATLFAASPSAVNLGSAKNFVILSKAAITNVPTSIITGNVGASPITGASIGLTCAEVTGNIYSTDATGPLPCRIISPTSLTTAISNMETAYTDAATRAAATGPQLNIGGGTVSTQTLVGGLYTWNTPVTITGDLTLSGTSADVWIFQISGTLDLEVGQNIILADGAVAENVFWQVADSVTIKTGSHFEGNILAKTNIAMQSGAELNGRALSQTEITLIANTINIPVETISTPLVSTLTVIKKVINDNGGDKDSSAFTINVTGTNVSDSSFPGEDTPGTVVTLSAGAYSVDEDTNSNYTKTLSEDCSGTIAEGEDKTCTITNNDILEEEEEEEEKSSGSRVIGSIPNYGSYTNSTVSTDTTIYTPEVITTVPSFPATGFSTEKEPNSWVKTFIHWLFDLFK